jgi:hypothetical protein
MKTNLSLMSTIPLDRDLCPDEVEAAVAKGLTVAILAKSSAEPVPVPPSEPHVLPVKETTQHSPGALRIYVCRNCGGRMKLPESIDFCGVPSCPVCGRVISRFDVVAE